MAIPDNTYNTGSQFKVAVVGDFNGQDDVIGNYEVVMQTGTSVNGQDVLDDLLEFFEDLYDIVGILVNILTIFRGIRVSELDGAEATGLLPFDTAIVGSNTANALPPGCAAVVNMPTGIKKVILRKYLGTLSIDDVGSTGKFTGTALTRISNCAAYMIASHVMTNQTWQISYQSPKAMGIVLPQGADVPNTVGYQRRRKQGVGG